MSSLCPCGSAQEYSACCEPYLTGRLTPQTPSHLMRSRYTAFVLKNADYLIKSWHPSCHAAQLRAELKSGFAQTQWHGLTVFDCADGQTPDEGFVSFVARFSENGCDGAIIERSRFLNENGRWYYIDGTRPQFGRNDPCPCGSGQKFKKCCGR